MTNDERKDNMPDQAQSHDDEESSPSAQVHAQPEKQTASDNDAQSTAGDGQCSTSELGAEDQVGSSGMGKRDEDAKVQVAFTGVSEGSRGTPGGFPSEPPEHDSSGEKEQCVQEQTTEALPGPDGDGTAEEKTAAEAQDKPTVEDGPSEQERERRELSAELVVLLNEVLTAREQALADIRDSRNLYDKCAELFDRIRSSQEKFVPEVERIIGEFDIPQAGQLPEDVTKCLENSKSGLDLVLKMTRKLADRAPQSKREAISESDVLQIDEATLASMAEDSAQARLREVDHKNHALATEMRAAADDSRQAFISFAKRHLLPVVDGVRDGQRFFQNTREKLEETYPEAEEHLTAWHERYDELMKQYDKLLEQWSIHPIEPETGQPVDYECHEPFETIEDENAVDESVHDVVRPGYRYHGDLYDALSPVIRPAQVVVAINKGQRTDDSKQ